MDFPFLKSLNKDQIEAVKHVNGPSIILAGAGSGKTRTLTYKTMYLLQGGYATPENILLLTFTNKAADEMKKRVRKMMKDLSFDREITATTFHSFSVSLLRRFGVPKFAYSRDFVIFDDADQKDVIKDLLKESSFGSFLKPPSAAHYISNQKMRLLTPHQASENTNNIFQEKGAKFYQLYEERMRELKAIDFDDLLFQGYMLLMKNDSAREYYQKRFKYVLIDEYQDTNHAQYMIARILTEHHHNITVVGDMAQSIYSWRGADFTNLDKFQTDYPDAAVFRLEQNYRSTQPILDFAYQVISQNQTHPILKLWTDKLTGEEIELRSFEEGSDEVDFIASKIKSAEKNGEYPLSEIAILYRTNSQSRALEEALLNYSIPYRIYGGTRFYERKEVKDILAFMRILINPADRVSRERIMKLGKKRGELIMSAIAKEKTDAEPVTIIKSLLDSTPYLELYDENDVDDASRLENIAELQNVAENFKTVTEFLDSVTLVETGYRFNAEEGTTVSLMTLHSAKGLEFSLVFLPGLEQGILPHARSIDNSEQLEEERRLFYVGVTRAKDKLYLTYAKRRQTYGRFQYTIASQFLDEAGLVTDSY